MGLNKRAFWVFLLLFFDTIGHVFLRVFKLAIVLNSSSVSCPTSSRCNYISICSD
jgi:hypothetical protein